MQTPATVREVKNFVFNLWPFKLLIPAYDGGNYEALGIKAKEITNWDPSPYTNSYLNDPKGKDLFTEEPIVEKEKAWVMASLLNKMNWLKKQTTKYVIKEPKKHQKVPQFNKKKP